MKDGYRDKIRLLVLSNATGVLSDGKALVYDRFIRRFGGYAKRFDTRLALLAEHSHLQVPSSELPAGVRPLWLPEYRSRWDLLSKLPRMIGELWKAAGDVDAVLICIPLLHGFPALAVSILRRKPVFILMIASWVETGRPKTHGGATSSARRMMARIASNIFGILASRLLIHGRGDEELIGPLKGKAIRVIESTLATEDLLGPDGTTNPPPLRLLYVGRLIATKRHDVALEALKILRDRGREATLTIVGDGPERAMLEGLAKRLSIDSFVTFQGFVDDRNELRRRYRESFSLLLPSETEGLSLAVMEAMAAGTPVISTGAGGMQDFLESGVDSIVVDRADPVKFADGVELLIEDPDLRLRIIKAAQEKVRALTHDKWVERLDSIVRERLGAP